MKLTQLFTFTAFSCLSFNSIASDTVTQGIDLVIPLVALIDVQDSLPAINFSSPNNAGDGFSAPVGITSTISVTSNNPNARLEVHTSSDLTDINLSLTDLSNLCSPASLSALSTSSQYCNMGTRQITGGSFTINAAPATANGMIPYGNYSTDIIYTITQN